MEDNKVECRIVDCKNLPINFPTHNHPPEFWEMFGRAVATFGALEEVLKRANLAFRAHTEVDYASKKDVVGAVHALENNLSDQLYDLLKSYEEIINKNKNLKIENAGDLIKDIEKAKSFRNMLIHSAWINELDIFGSTVPIHYRDSSKYKYKQKKSTPNPEEFTTKIDLNYIKQIQKFTTNILIAVMDTVTCMGWEFPETSDPKRYLSMQLSKEK